MTEHTSDTKSQQCPECGSLRIKHVIDGGFCGFEDIEEYRACGDCGKRMEDNCER